MPLPLLPIALGAGAAYLLLRPGMALAAGGGAGGGLGAALGFKPLTGPELAQKYLGWAVGAIPAADRAALEAYARETYKAASDKDHAEFIAAAVVNIGGAQHGWDGQQAWGNGVAQVGVAGGQYDNAGREYFEAWSNPAATIQLAQMIRHHGQTLLQRALSNPIVGGAVKLGISAAGFVAGGPVGAAAGAAVSSKVR